MSAEIGSRRSEYSTCINWCGHWLVSVFVALSHSTNVITLFLQLCASTACQYSRIVLSRREALCANILQIARTTRFQSRWCPNRTTFDFTALCALKPVSYTIIILRIDAETRGSTDELTTNSARILCCGSSPWVRLTARLVKPIYRRSLKLRSYTFIV